MTNFTFDAHCDTLGHATLPEVVRRDLTQWGSFGHLDLPRMRAGGINCQIFACFPGYNRLRDNPGSEALRRVEAMHALIDRVPDQITLVQTVDDLQRLTPGGPIGAILGLEGCEALDGDLGRLHTYYQLGVRNLGLAWDGRNDACDGVKVGSGFGLTPFGREVVEMCNRLGIMIDVSHLNAAGVEDVQALSEHPIIASHSNARALFDHPRNLTDAQIRAIADKGGVIGATFVAMFMAEDIATATSEHVLDHIDYLVQVAGEDHVGIGSDFDGCDAPSDLNSGENYPKITDGLRARGYAEDTIRKISGENFRRVFAQVLP